jgi:hypothetical protein
LIFGWRSRILSVQHAQEFSEIDGMRLLGGRAFGVQQDDAGPVFAVPVIETEVIVRLVDGKGQQAVYQDVVQLDLVTLMSMSWYSSSSASYRTSQAGTQK